MSPGKKISGRNSSGRGRSSAGKKPFGKGKTGGKTFSDGRAKPYKKREDRDEKPYSDRPAPYKRADDRKDFKKPFDKKFSSSGSGSKPFSKRDDRDEKPYSDRSKPFQRSDEKRDFKKPYEKKFSSSRGGSKPFAKRDDGDRKPYSDRSKPFERSGDRKDFKKPYEKKSFGERSKPFAKRDDRDDKPYGDHAKPFERSDGRRDFKKPYEKKSFGERSKPFTKRDDRDERPSRNRSDDRPTKGFVKYGDKKSSDERSKPFTKRDDRDERPSRDRSDDKPGRGFVKYGDKKISDEHSKPFSKHEDRDEKPFENRSETFRPSDDGNDFVKSDERPKRRRKDDASSDSAEPKWNRKSGHEFYGDRKKERRGFDKKERTEPYKANEDGSIRLNKYISNSGICSRREADELISAGVVSVNGEIMTELGYKVKPGDEVKYNNETLRTEKLVYILVNKPKDFITTVDDPQDRKTVMWLIRDACRERVYPVGRLDRNTTGVLLFTNDGELAKKLTHPSFEVQKIYQAELDAPLKPSDMEQIANGLTLDDGYIKVDDIAYSAVGKDKSVVGVEIHSGRNRIVRRLFEHFGYVVKKLDRVYFAGLSKKDLPRGRWRFLTPIEISNLKMMTGNKKMQKYFEA